MKKISALIDGLKYLKTNKIMKNIHVLPTDKPSRLYLGDNGNFVFGIIQTSIQSRNDDFTNQNIYITSDEEIKEGDWGYNSINNTVYQKKLDKISFAYEYKIILTTDQDLIKDGVQDIDDEFLEWFIKNPSCESVDIEEEKKAFDNEHRGIPFALDEDDYVKKIYKIIIPNEEAKQETLNHIVYNIGDSIRIINPTENQPKLFTTHKVDNDFGVVYYYQLDGKEESIGFSYIKKEEPKQERSYSEGDLREAYFSAIKSTGEGWNGEYANGNNPNIEEKFTEGFEEWFEKFKNK